MKIYCTHQKSAIYFLVLFLALSKAQFAKVLTNDLVGKHHPEVFNNKIQQAIKKAKETNFSRRIDHSDSIESIIKRIKLFLNSKESNREEILKQFLQIHYDILQLYENNSQIEEKKVKFILDLLNKSIERYKNHNINKMISFKNSSSKNFKTGVGLSGWGIGY